MSDELLLRPPDRPNAFPASSRYAPVEVAKFVGSGREVPYLRRRFVPQPESLADASAYVVENGDRLDRIAAETLGDPELYWRICDANRALRPEELETPPGRRLRITLPEGIPGAPSA
jgi:nucleoid-associated protein YgaU